MPLKPKQNISFEAIKEMNGTKFEALRDDLFLAVSVVFSVTNLIAREAPSQSQKQIEAERRLGFRGFQSMTRKETSF